MEVWKDVEASDGYSGNVVTPTQVGTSWAQVRTVAPERRTDFGLTENEYALDIRVRHRNDLDYFAEDIYFKYNGDSYISNGMVDDNLEGVEIRIIATKL